MRALVMVAVLGGTAVGAGAQEVRPKPTTAVMRGQVQDGSHKVLEGAEVSILGLGVSATTPASGNYRLDSITPGKYWVVVRRIGYAPLRAALSFQKGEDREIIFELETLAQALPELSVRAEDERWNRRHADFVWRSRVGSGVFLTRDDLEKFPGQDLSWVVRRYVPFFSNLGWGNATGLSSGWGHTSLGWGTNTWGSFGGCSPAVSLNGGRPLGWGLSDFRAEDVEAVEIYRSGRRLPIEFDTWGAGCGLVVVWTG